MNAPTVEYRGHTIRWSDNEDKWSCSDFSVSSASLAAVRRNIDDHYRRLRKSAAVECLRVSEYSHPFTSDATLVEYLGAKESRSRNRETGAQEVTVWHEVAAMSARRAPERPGRTKGKLDEFIANTPENVAVLTQADDLIRESKRLEKAARTLVAGIPRLTIDDIAGLVQAGSLQEGSSD